MKMYNIASSSKGNSSILISDNAKILIDVGVSAKRIKEALFELNISLEDIDAILITHEHIDHIRALGTITRSCHTPVFATTGTVDGILNTASVKITDSKDFNIIKARDVFSIKDISIQAIRINHDANDPVAYRFTDGNINTAIITDLGSYDDELLSKLENLDAILIEANHDEKMLQCGSYPDSLKKRILGKFGHLSNRQTHEILNKIYHSGLKKIMLAHLSDENNMPFIALKSVENNMKEFNGNLNIDVANFNTLQRII